MKLQDYHIIPYSESYHDKVCALEQGIVQGRKIQLEIIKANFLDRANIFKNHYSCIAVTNENEVVGSAIGAQTTVMINRQQSAVGIAFDTKVDPCSRGRGIGKAMVRDIYTKFYNPMGLRKNLMVAKQSNSAVVKLASKAVHNIWFYDFVYLTIPTSNRVEIPASASRIPQLLSIQLFDEHSLPGEFYSTLQNGLSYFETHKLYRLKIKNINWFYKQGISFLKLVDEKYRSLPGENETLSLATLFNHTPENIHEINQVLEELRSKGIKQLLVCCRRHDYIYRVLRKASINQYQYNLVSDFHIGRNDQVAIDVRCL